MAAKRKSAALRAYYSAPTSTRQAIRKANNYAPTKAGRAAAGRVIRRGRLARGSNPNTGSHWRAGQLGLTGQARKSYKALTPKAKQGMVRAVAGKAGGRKGVARRVRKHYRTSAVRK